MSHYHWVRIDETDKWKKQFLASIGSDTKIISTYIFDINNIIGSLLFDNKESQYELYRVSTEFIVAENISHEHTEEINAKISSAQECDDIVYLSCKIVNDNKPRPIQRFIGVETGVANVLKYYKENPW